MKNLLIVLTICIAPPLRAHSQALLTEFNLESNRVDDIQAFPLGDSVFVSFSEPHTKRTYWVNADGEKREISMRIPPKASIIGVTADADHTLYYYYLNEINEQMVIEVMNQPVETEEPKFANATFLLTGELLGIDADKGGITVVSYFKKQHQVRIFRLKGAKQENETFFAVPFHGSKWIKDDAGFIVNNVTANVQQGSKKLKLYDEGTNVILSLDEDGPGLKSKKTTVIKMNVETGDRQIYQLQRHDYDRFISCYYSDKLYQFSHSTRKRLRFDAFDVTTGKLLFTNVFERDKSMQEQKVIVHRGKSVEVGYTTLYEMVNMSEDIPSVAVQSTGDAGDIRVLLGSVDNYVEPVVIPFLFPLLEGTAILTLYVTPVHSNVRYMTLAGNTEEGFQVEVPDNDQSASLREFIDRYEISKTSGRAPGEPGWDLHFKGYVQLEDGVVGLYRIKGKRLLLIKYDSNQAF